MVGNVFRKKVLIALVGWLLITVHYLVFSQFLPNAQGKLGHDYMYVLPMLLDGYYWFLNNGPFSAPLFTPSFCGGMPLLANPATFYFSGVQFLTFLLDPLTSVRCTFFLFAALGFWGFYLLLTRTFATSQVAGLLGGTLFLFNGLYAYRLIIGHIEFHSIMLVPLLAWILLREQAAGPLPAPWGRAAQLVLAGVLIAYMFMSGMTQLLIPALLAVILVALVKALLTPEAPVLRRFSIGLALAGSLALALSGAKLVAALAFLENFQRDSYFLPGVPGFGTMFLLLFRVLALGGAGIDTTGQVVNAEFIFERHELEYGLSVVPFLLLATAAALNFAALPAKAKGLLNPRQLPSLGLILLLLLIPLALNYYSPAWNHFLKTVPLIKSLSNFFRWFIIYIPFLILLACLALEKNVALRRRGWPILAAAIVIVLGQTLAADKTFYAQQKYDPRAVQAAYARSKGDGRPPSIRNLYVPVDAAGKPVLFTANRNDALTNGESALLCYEPMFGYQLEFLPFKSSHAGPTLAATDGFFNLKNPACYLYPQENQCQPGDHFRLEERGEAENFIAFRPFAHRTSTAQRLANALSLLSLLGVALFAGLTAWLRLRPKIKPV